MKVCLLLELAQSQLFMPASAPNLTNLSSDVRYLALCKILSADEKQRMATPHALYARLVLGLDPMFATLLGGVGPPHWRYRSHWILRHTGVCCE